MANVSALLTLALALVWRFRDMTWRPSIVLGLAVSTKLFLWPLLVWPAAMRRYRTATRAVAVGLGVTCAAWAAIGFAGLTSYPALLTRFDKDWSGQSYSIVGIAASLGLEPAVGRALTLSVGGALLIARVSLGRKGDDARSFMCAVAASLFLTPVMWLHYLVLLPVPLAIARPRFSLIWLVPIVLWVCSPRSDDGVVLATLPLAVASAIFCAALVRPVKVRFAEQAPA